MEKSRQMCEYSNDSTMWSKSRDSKRVASRPIAKLEFYNPATKSLAKRQNFDYFQSWNFFEQPDSTIIGPNVLARMEWNPEFNSDFFFLGRQSQSGRPTVVKFSKFQGVSILSFISMILDQVSKKQDDGDANFESIPYFQGKDTRIYSWKGDRNEFWSSADIDLNTVRVGLVVSSTTGLPELLLNNPVPREVSKRFGNWPGPTIALRLSGMERLESFMLSHHLEIKKDLIRKRPKKSCWTPPPSPTPKFSQSGDEDFDTQPY